MSEVKFKEFVSLSNEKPLKKAFSSNAKNQYYEIIKFLRQIRAFISIRLIKYYNKKFFLYSEYLFIVSFYYTLNRIRNIKKE